MGFKSQAFRIRRNENQSIRGKYVKRVLIIEDEEIISKLERELLEQAGFEVEVATDGVEGLKKIKQNEYDAIISNGLMPIMTGEKLYLEVKKLDPELAKRIIFVATNFTDFVKSTGSLFLRKPFDNQHFLKTIKDFLSQDEV